jgi:hypothetical protein
VKRAKINHLMNQINYILQWQAQWLGRGDSLLQKATSGVKQVRRPEARPPQSHEGYDHATSSQVYDYQQVNQHIYEEFQNGVANTTGDPILHYRPGSNGLVTVTKRYPAHPERLNQRQT